MVKKQNFAIFDLMDQQRFLDILRNPQSISKSDAGELLELRNNFPYFQLSYVLTTLAARQSSSIYFEELLKKTAITTIDRKKLKTLIEIIPKTEHAVEEQVSTHLATEENVAILEELHEEPETPSSAQEEPHEFQQENEVILQEETPLFTNEHSIISEEILEEKNLVSEAATLPQEETTEDMLTEINNSQSHRVVPAAEAIRSITHLHAVDSYRHQEGPVENPEINAYNDLIDRFLEASKEAKNISRESNAIDSFLKNTPKIKKAPLIPSEDTEEREDLSEKFTNNSEEFFSESLANIYTKQGKYAKAIETYKKLILTNPQKSAYFASKIIEIENLQK